ncbi:hypothetical protein ABGV42_01095 [Paenibacillus pabuli]|uniref:hypothetical protein n=1 Tax=Paenibacillus pabuli TaxID=1472 RepID=UPI003242B551
MSEREEVLKLVRAYIEKIETHDFHDEPPLSAKGGAKLMMKALYSDLASGEDIDHIIKNLNE